MSKDLVTMTMVCCLFRRCSIISSSAGLPRQTAAHRSRKRPLVASLVNHTLYVHWEPDTCVITFDNPRPIPLGRCPRLFTSCAEVRHDRRKILDLIAKAIGDKLSGNLPPEGSVLSVVYDNVDSLSETMELDNISELSESVNIGVGLANTKNDVWLGQYQSLQAMSFLFALFNLRKLLYIINSLYGAAEFQK